jgi:hypothetical protein
VPVYLNQIAVGANFTASPYRCKCHALLLTHARIVFATKAQCQKAGRKIPFGPVFAHIHLLRRVVSCGRAHWRSLFTRFKNGTCVDRKTQKSVPGGMDKPDLAVFMSQRRSLAVQTAKPGLSMAPIVMIKVGAREPGRGDEE